MKPHFPAAPIRRLLPGELFCERGPYLIGTILGSCVAVCLWDKRLRFGGMNHYILPDDPSRIEPSNRFGQTAIAALVARMTELGSEPKDLQAKLFGGATVLHTGRGENSVGRRNIEVAMTELRRHRVPIVASRLSGREGVAIMQCTSCSDVWVRTIARSAGFQALAPRTIGGGEPGTDPLSPREVQELSALPDTLEASLFGPNGTGTLQVARLRAPAPGVRACPTCGSAAPRTRTQL